MQRHSLRTLVTLVAPALAGCLPTPGRPVDIDIVAVADLPDFGPDTQIQVASYSWTKSAAATTSIDPDCLVDPGTCDVTFFVGGLGHAGADTYVWLDIDGDDAGDLHKALLDDDLLGYLSVNISSLPYDTRPLVELDFPEVLIDGE